MQLDSSRLQSSLQKNAAGEFFQARLFLLSCRRCKRVGQTVPKPLASCCSYTLKTRGAATGLKVQRRVADWSMIVDLFWVFFCRCALKGGIPNWVTLMTISMTWAGWSPKLLTRRHALVDIPWPLCAQWMLLCCQLIWHINCGRNDNSSSLWAWSPCLQGLAK